MAEKDRHHKDLKKSAVDADTSSPNKGSEAYNQMRKRGDSITTDKAQAGLPDEKTINEEFVPLAAKMGLKEDQIAKMTLLQKWTTVLQFQEKQSDSTTLENKPAEVVKELEKGKNKIKTLVRVRTLLTTETVDWCSEFIKLKGHQRLFDIFVATSEKKAGDKEKELLAECCRCMKALMNTSEGFQKALEFEPSVRLLIQSLELINIVSQTQVLYLLAAICVVSPEAHNRVLIEMRRVNQYPTLMDNFKLKDAEILTATLTFMNALTGSLRDTETRVTLRNEFVRMNIKDYLRKLVEQSPKEELLVQIKIFEDGLESDRGNFAAGGGISSEEWEKHQSAHDELKAKYEKIQTQFHSLEFEKTNLEQEVARLKTALANAPKGGSAAPAATAHSGDSQAASASHETGAPPPPPPPGGDSGAPPPPPPPGGDGGPPPPPPPPGGDGGPPPPPPPPGGDGGPPPPPPPPGGPGGPPPPPPPPGAKGGIPPPPGAAKAGRPPKPKRKPNRKMKGFVWNKIADNKIDNTVWDKTDDMKVHFDTREFEEMFGEREKEVVEMPVSPRDAAPKVEKKQKITLLDPKRSNNCNIMLRGIKMSPADIKKAVASFDDSILKEDQLRAIKDFVPTPEEAQILKDYSGDKNELAPAEQFMLEVLSVPGFGVKVSAMLFRIQFSEKSDIAKTEINLLSKAIDALKANKKFQDLLEIVLAFGNYLNGQSNRGGCWGVRLNSLPKMFEVKSADGKLTLMHYFVDFLEKKHKELLTLLEDLKAAEEASRLNIRETTSKVNELKTGFNTIDTQLNAPDADPKFKSAMQPFVDKARETIQALDSRVSKLEPSFKEILNYYGEPASTETEDFFGTLAAFVNGMARARAENAKRVELAAKEEKARALQAELKAKAVGGAMKKKGHIDDAIEGMKSGKLFQRMSVRIADK